jgi:hypothetical protein
MSAQRKLIREAARQHLLNKTAANANVFASRSRAIWEADELPAIAIYGVRETITVEIEAPREYRRELELRIECIVASTANADDDLDDLGDTVERIIGRSDRLLYAKDHVVSDIILNSQQIEFREDGEQTVAALVIVYTATYFTTEPDELDPNPVDDLKSVGTKYSLEGRQAEPERAADEVQYAEN